MLTAKLQQAEAEALQKATQYAADMARNNEEVKSQADVTIYEAEEAATQKFDMLAQAEQAKAAAAEVSMATMTLQLAAAEESATAAALATKAANDLAAAAEAERSLAEMATLVAEQEMEATKERATALAKAEARASLEVERLRVGVVERELAAERAARRGAESAASEKAAVDRALTAAQAECERYKAHLEVAAAAAREESAARCVAEMKQQELEGMLAQQTSHLNMAGQAAAAAADEAGRRAKDAGDAAVRMEQESRLQAERNASESSAIAAEGAVALKQMFVVLRQAEAEAEKLRRELDEERKHAMGARQVRDATQHSLCSYTAAPTRLHHGHPARCSFLSLTVFAVAWGCRRRSGRVRKPT